MNKKSIIRSVAKEYLTHQKEIKGITLIALVITTIVLLVLAGVTIVTLIGDNGLLQKSTDARNKTINADAEEEIRLAWNKAYMDSYMDENLSIADALAVELENKATVTPTSNGWTIQFNDTQRQYSLSADGRTINLLSENTQPGIQTITFTIEEDNNSNFKTYTAEEGMTWQQWVDSTYNTDGIIIDDGYVLNSTRTRAVLIRLQGNDIWPTFSNEVIQPNSVEYFWGVDWHGPF